MLLFTLNDTEKRRFLREAAFFVVETLQPERAGCDGADGIGRDSAMKSDGAARFADVGW